MSESKQTFAELLVSLNACREAREWAGDKTIEEVWATCERGDWMLWLAGKFSGPPESPSRKKLVGVAAECAELTLPIYEKRRPNDSQPRDCIEGCKQYSRGEITRDQLRVLRRAAAAADAAAAAAADAAAYADAASYAAATAYATAYAVAADARTKVLKQCAEIVRQHYPTPPENCNE